MSANEKLVEELRKTVIMQDLKTILGGRFILNGNIFL